jgi:hypothetical protein
MKVMGTAYNHPSEKVNGNDVFGYRLRLEDNIKGDFRNIL